MTRAEMATKAPGLYIPQAFAAGDATHQKQFKDILNEIDGSDVNFIEGFTSAFEAPSSQGGRYVSRKELNAIGHLASANWFKRMVGGIFTFNANLAVKIGGYPKGAVLEHLDGLNYYRVISLIDNNKVDFTGTEPTSQQQTAGIVQGAVDGVNWAYCERGFIEEGKQQTVPIDIEFPSGTITFSTAGNAIPCGIFVSPRSGYLSVYGTASMTPTGSRPSIPGGFGVIVKKAPFDGGPWDSQYSTVYTNGDYVTAIMDKVSYSDANYSLFSVEQGGQYDVQLVGCDCTATLDLKVKIV